MNLATSHTLGTFQLNSDKLIVTDPCYDRDTWCQGILDDALQGTWTATIEQTECGPWGNRVASLTVKHSDFPGAYTWERANFKVGVDSGQAGIFDESLYPHGDTGEYKDKESFYGRCCALTENTGGVIEWGAVTPSGYGDGGYSCFFHRNQDGKIVAVRVVYLTDDDDASISDDDDDASEDSDSNGDEGED